MSLWFSTKSSVGQLQHYRKWNNKIQDEDYQIKTNCMLTSVCYSFCIFLLFHNKKKSWKKKTLSLTFYYVSSLFKTALLFRFNLFSLVLFSLFSHLNQQKKNGIISIIAAICQLTLKYSFYCLKIIHTFNMNEQRHQT